MRLSVIGTGYVGLVTGACLAERGHSVTCVDLDRQKVDAINSGAAPFFEKDLPDLLQRQIGKRLFATTNLQAAVRESDVTFIAVGTPAANGQIDLRAVEAAAAEVGSAMAKKGAVHTLVVKSTVIPGTTDGAVRRSVEAASGMLAGRDFGLGMNPEFLTEGSAIQDFMHPDRLVFGGIDDRTHEVLSSVYGSFASTPVIRTNNSTAEMIKYASNSILATMISFSNEMAGLCSAIGGVDIVDVMRGVHASGYFTTLIDGRSQKATITSFLEAGCGFGGSCLPKDVLALVAQGAEHGVPMALLRSVLEINQNQPGELLRLIARHNSDLRGTRVTVLGLAFKPDTDDIRESPAFPVIARLRDKGALVTAYDPVVHRSDHPDLQAVTFAGSLREALANAEIVVLVTRWEQFLEIGAILKDMDRRPLVVDGRRVLNAAEFSSYEGIGR